LDFEIGKQQVIKGLEVAVQHMDVGSLCEVTIPSCYAYKDVGLPPLIPPNAVLVYHIELIGIVSH
jgi:FKBP-type peptidyl-prolyl cis-trans isomerase